MKYFVCKETPKFDNNTNSFIATAFAYSSRYGMFSVGYIYRTTSWSDSYIMDGNGVSIALMKIAYCFEEFNVKIEPEAAKIMATKAAKGDEIYITPIQVMFDGTVVYNVSCYSGGKLSNYIGTSQYDCIINCYRDMRGQELMIKVFRHLFLYNEYPYSLLKKMKEKNERIRKHT